jgi:plasmid replication initiation protein
MSQTTNPVDNSSKSSVVAEKDKVLRCNLEYPKEVDAEMKCFQSNELTQALYTMSAVEKKIFSIMVSKINPDDEGFQKLVFETKNLIGFLENRRTSDNYSFLQETLERLQKRVIKIRERNVSVKGIEDRRYNATLHVQLLGHYRNIPEAGLTELSFNPEMLPYLVNLKKTFNFTVVNLRLLMNLKSFYSIRFLELCSQYSNTGWFVLSVKAIKTMFLIEDKYKLYADFRRYVLEKSREELIREDYIWFDYKEERRGRRVERIFFTIYQKKKPESEEVKKLKERMMGEFKLSRSYTSFLVKKLTRAEISRILYDVNLSKANGVIRGNIGGYTRGVFEKQYPELDRGREPEVKEAEVVGLPLSHFEEVAGMMGLSVSAFMERNGLVLQNGMVCKAGRQ